MEQLSGAISNFFNTFRFVRFSDIVDILIVAYLIYLIFNFVRKNHAFRLAKGLLVLAAVFVVSYFMNLTMIKFFLTKGLELGLIAVVILFQPELRRILERLGSGKLARILSSNTSAKVGSDTVITQTALAYQSMSQSRTGALMVFERHTNLSEFTSTGTMINADISGELIRNIFFEPAPLHDGAVIVRGDKIIAAGCMLPLSNSNTLSHDLGMRHRAAIGITEHTDAIVAVVSEETGAISIAINGMIKRHLDIETFEEILRSELIEENGDSPVYSDKFAAIISVLKGKKNDENQN
ncbi:MAG: diadenylate cyclase CdaA [Oscillospiraceae bacterium]|nr:diadenylate cyclase CdaA [Oscillospiraceae bacterium]